MRTFSLASFAAFSALAIDNGADVPAIVTETPATIEAATVTETPAAKPAKRDRKPSAKPVAKAANAKPVKAVKAADVAKPDASAGRSERILAERSLISAIYSVFEAQRVSVPVKTLSAFKPETSSAHPSGRNPSVRQASAIAVAFAGSKKQIKAGATAARVFEHNGARLCLENGVMRDAIASGLITVSGDSAHSEKLTIASKRAAETIIGLIGATAANAGKLA